MQQWILWMNFPLVSASKTLHSHDIRFTQPILGPSSSEQGPDIRSSPFFRLIPFYRSPSSLHHLMLLKMVKLELCLTSWALLFVAVHSTTAFRLEPPLFFFWKQKIPLIPISRNPMKTVWSSISTLQNMPNILHKLSYHHIWAQESFFRFLLFPILWPLIGTSLIKSLFSRSKTYHIIEI